jgi:maltose O-acetyltransferase
MDTRSELSVAERHQPGSMAKAHVRRRLLPRLWAAISDDVAHVRPRLLLVDLLVRLLPHFTFSRLRTALLRAGGISIGPRSLIGGRVHLMGPGAVAGRLRIGADCYISGPMYVDLCSPVHIGDGVTIGTEARFITADHEIGPSRRRAGPMRASPIAVHDGAWLAAGVVVLPGASIGAGSVIGAGSLVRGAIPPDVLAAGVPARVKRAIEP